MGGSTLPTRLRVSPRGEFWWDYSEACEPEWLEAVDVLELVLQVLEDEE